MRDTWRRELRRSATWRLVAVLGVAASGLGMLAGSAVAGYRCDQELCIEILLPPHIQEIPRASILEVNVILPAPAKPAKQFQVLLKKEPLEPSGCTAIPFTILEGSMWKRVAIDLKTLRLEPGTYLVGVAEGIPGKDGTCPPTVFWGPRRVTVMP